MKTISILIFFSALAACQSQTDITKSTFQQACIEKLEGQQEDLSVFELKKISYVEPQPFDFPERLDYMVKTLPVAKRNIGVAQSWIDSFEGDNKSGLTWSESDKRMYYDLRAQSIRESETLPREIEEASGHEEGDRPVKLSATLLYVSMDEESDDAMKTATCTKYAYRGFYDYDDRNLKYVDLK